MLPIILPGYLEGAVALLEQSLQQMGFPAVTVPLRAIKLVTHFGGRPVTPILQLSTAL